MKSLLIGATLLLSLFDSRPLLAQTTQPSAPAASPTPPPAAVEAGTKPKPNMVDATIGLAWGGPTRLTGSATIMWGQPKMLVAFSPGKLFQVRVGTRGGQIGLGLVAGVFEDSLVKPQGLAVTLKAVAIRSWRDPSGVTNGHTYAGLESDIIILGIRGSLGYARKVSGDGGPDGRFVWSLGLGL
ncbi:MAG: hypothetical protein KA385_01515 [Vicinamibacteria bacterium]|jgi:hypothetical protein|nr:hypothetical protein [Vicinamibacteria bacterium]